MSWAIPRIWEDADVWIIGGGPSVIEQFNIPDDVVQKVRNKIEPMSAFSPYMEYLHDKHVIGINVAYLLGDWIDICFFGDVNFFLHRKEELAQFPGLKITCTGLAETQDWMKVMAKDTEHSKGLSSRPDRVSWNGNSGAAAISIAAWAGAKRILLLGFDMKLDDTKYQHFHNAYGKGSIVKEDDLRKLPFYRHLWGFSEIQKDAKERGIAIINVNPNSAIIEFPKKSLKEIINERG